MSGLQNLVAMPRQLLPRSFNLWDVQLFLHALWNPTVLQSTHVYVDESLARPDISRFAKSAIYLSLSMLPMV